MYHKEAIRKKLYGDPRRYELRGQTLAQYTRGTPAQILRIGLDLLDLKPSEVVADAGAGSGYFADLVSSRTGNPVFAFDISSGQVLNGYRRYPHLHWCVCDVEAIPAPSQRFDAACANFMLYHLLRPEIALFELARILRNEGRLLILTKGHNTYAEMDRWYRLALAQFGLSDNAPRDESRISELNIDELLPPAMQVEKRVCVESWVDFPTVEALLDYFASTPRYHYYVTEEQWKNLLGAIGQEAPKAGLSIRKIEWAFLVRVRHY